MRVIERPWTSRDRRVLVGVLLVAALIRIVLAFTTYGITFDINNYRIAAGLVTEDPIGLYDVAGSSWPYPPGLLPWLVVARVVAGRTPLPFHGVIQLAPIMGDLATCLLIALALHRRGARWGAATAAVAFGPVFVMVSGYHGQFDALAFLPALIGFLYWRDDRPRRAMVAGVLIGLGGLLKTVPVIALLFLLPTARSQRERVELFVSAGAVVLLGMAPFLLHDPTTAAIVLRYSGAAGIAGWSVWLQPELADYWILREAANVSRITLVVADWATVLTGCAVGAVALWAHRRRLPPDHTAVLCMLAVYAVSPNLFFQYFIWGLGFLLLAGRIRLAIVAQVVLFPPMFIALLAPWDLAALAPSYVAWMTVVWVATVMLFVRELRRLHTLAPAPPEQAEPATQ